ncbi:MAG TPA: G1 family glutamic endopeptidase [Candidatus Cybelea sp.]|nr:G1 family glutamic endopeptidase [Candidatus Cybelea sp.]
MRALVFAALVASLAACNGGAVTPVTGPPATPASSACGAAPQGAVAPAPTAQIRRVYQPDWAGPVLFAPGQVSLRIPAHRFCEVEGEWTVPYAKPTINCSNRHEPVDGSSLWIAIDGWSGTFRAHQRGKDGKWHTYPSTDILQAGSESDVDCYHGGPLGKYRTTAYFWIEWSGVRNVRVTRRWRNLPLNPGDTIYVRIAATTTGSRAWQEATLWLVDETTGKAIPPRTFHSGCVDCGTPFSRPATLFGNTVEWITEATFYDADNPKWPNTLDDFGSVKVGHIEAVDQDGTVYDLAHPHGGVENVDWMTWNGLRLSEKGVLLACTTIDSPREATLSRAPYVITTPGDQGELKPRPKNCN